MSAIVSRQDIERMARKNGHRVTGWGNEGTEDEPIPHTICENQACAVSAWSFTGGYHFQHDGMDKPCGGTQRAQS